ncbi:hypothetical protein K438DRAFT_1752440 [Mycena galopus ATCC 62051]|nr:hypothetical protein K438DRAFT_1752440 [Mycena galopus ATCC 62051]
MATGMFVLCIAVTDHKRRAPQPLVEETPPDDGARWYLVDEDFKTTRRARSWAGEERNPIIHHDYVKGTRRPGGYCAKTEALRLSPNPPGLHQPQTITPNPRQRSSLPNRIHGDPPTPLSEASEVPELITDEDLEATPPYEERLSTSARTRLDRIPAEMVQGSRQ